MDEGSKFARWFSMCHFPNYRLLAWQLIDFHLPLQAPDDGEGGMAEYVFARLAGEGRTSELQELPEKFNAALEAWLESQVPLCSYSSTPESNPKLPGISQSIE